MTTKCITVFDIHFVMSCMFGDDLSVYISAISTTWRPQVASHQKKRSAVNAPVVDDKRMRALAAAMVRESEREALQGIRLELEQARCLSLFYGPRL